MVSSGLPFMAWLHQPFLDLAPVIDNAPSFTVAIEFDRRSLLEERNYPMPWVMINPAFRKELTQRAALPEYDVSDPRQLAAELRTADWQRLCDGLDDFPGLTTAGQVRVIRLLNRLGFTGSVRTLVPADIANRLTTDEDMAGLAWLRAVAGLRADGEDLDTSTNTKEVEAVATCAPDGLWKTAALYQMVRQTVKFRGDIAAAEYWHALHQKAVQDARSSLSPMEYLMAMSKLHRVGAFIPQMKRDAFGTAQEMDLAEHYAREATLLAQGATSDAEMLSAYAEEISYPVRESRIKEALWIQDLDLALARSLAHRDVRPLDGRGWMNCGEVFLKAGDPGNALSAFREAARLSPPAGAMLHFMVGHCLEALGQLDQALDYYLISLQIDPLAISSAESAMRLTGKVSSPVRIWTEKTVQDLTSLQRLEPGTEERHHHRRLPPPRAGRPA